MGRVNRGRIGAFKKHEIKIIIKLNGKNKMLNTEKQTMNNLFIMTIAYQTEPN